MSPQQNQAAYAMKLNSDLREMQKKVWRLRATTQLVACCDLSEAQAQQVIEAIESNKINSLKAEF